jgi:hypothetical protein
MLYLEPREGDDVEDDVVRKFCSPRIVRPSGKYTSLQEVSGRILALPEKGF